MPGIFFDLEGSSNPVGDLMIICTGTSVLKFALNDVNLPFESNGYRNSKTTEKDRKNIYVMDYAKFWSDKYNKSK